MAGALAWYEEVSPPAISLRRNLPNRRKRAPDHRSRPRTSPSRLLENPPILNQVSPYHRFAPLSQSLAVLSGVEVSANPKSISSGASLLTFHSSPNYSVRPRQHIRRNRLTILDFRLFDHRITLSALAKTLGGIVNPICFAVFKLMTSSNFIGCSTGSSAGLAPFRSLST
jgi:hypothetical protein